MSVADFAADALMWIGRVVKILPVFKEFWHAVRGNDPDQVFAAQMEMTRAVRREQAREEVEGAP